MSSDMAYEIEEFLESLGSLAATQSLSGLVSLAAYILGAIALYSLSQRRGIHHAWLSWIPVGNLWILGSLADQYQYVAHREVKNKRKVLLTLSLIQLVISLIISGVIIGAIVGIAGGAMGYSSEDELAAMAVGSVMGILFLCLPMIGISIAKMVIRFMALYNVYQSAAPENATMFLVLSIFFRVTEPFFLFFNRQKDDGMVYRQTPPAYQPPAYMNTPENGGSWTEPQQPQAPQQPQNPQDYQNPQGSAEPWTEQPKHQDPWDQGPEQL